MTDEEIICKWSSQWWRLNWRNDRKPITLTLDALWEIEEQLRNEQNRDMLSPWSLYREQLSHIEDSFHATPEQKIKALAAVLEPLVKTAPAPESLVVQLFGPLCSHCYKPKMNCDCD